MRKINVRNVPELRTSVGIHGTMKQKEVGGGACTGIFIAVVTG